MTWSSSIRNSASALSTAALAILFASPITAVPLRAQADEELSVLMVVAHPDDEAMFSGTVYKITHELGGAVDLALITDGSGGYRYSHLAEPIYGLDLTDEKVARQYLPAIRKRELMEAGKIIGVRNYFFFDEYDHQFTRNVDTVLQHVWDTGMVRDRLSQIMDRGDYDFVFAHLPIPNFHGHHKAATILALEASQEVDADRRPIVLGSFVGVRNDTTWTEFTELDGHPITRVRDPAAPFVFDLMQPIDESGRLNYRIIVNWEIAEHKSQGTMQLLMNRPGGLERFWFFEVNDPAGLGKVRELFERLGEGAVTSSEN